MHSPEKYDVVIVGGGPAGATTARCLADAGHRVLLADRSDPVAFKIGEGLPPAARTLLSDLGLWERFVDEGHVPCYGNISIWGSPHPHCTDFVFDPNGHGWHLDRPRFDRFLRAAARAAGADVREKTVVCDPVRRPGGIWQLELRVGRHRASVECQWLVDATGRGCVLARSQGAQRRIGDALVGVYARFRTADDGSPRDRDTRTLIEAVPEGWWYTALVPSGHRVVTYLTDTDLLEPAARTPSGFLALLAATRHIRACLATHGYILETDPRGAPARSSWLATPAGNGWLAVGDAALSCDPLSSQGILTALYTGIAASQAVHRHLSGEAEVLSRYQRALDSVNTRYQQNRTAFYQLEQRWPRHPFWRRRHRDAVRFPP